jgi:hypothetical protein
MTKKGPIAGAGTWRESFGHPPVVEGEDAAAYDKLSGRLYAAVKPADAIDEMYVEDTVCLEWEVLRWRRLKSSIIRVLRTKALKRFLMENLGYDQYRKKFEDALTEILLENLGDGQTTKDARQVARDCAKNSPEAVDAVNAILDRINSRMERVLDEARAEQVRSSPEISCGIDRAP